MLRRSIVVIAELLNTMNEIVTDYGDLVRTGEAVGRLIQGTACFPGGTGLWRGDRYGGPIPEFFPERPVMFLGHNFDSKKAYCEALQNKGEIGKPFWTNLKGFLANAGPLNPEECFFTNALMGLQPLEAAGELVGGLDFSDQCTKFLLKQIEIVQPRAVVPLGGDARREYRRATTRGLCARNNLPHVMHPSARPKDQKPHHFQWLVDQGNKIREIVTSAGSGS